MHLTDTAIRKVKPGEKPVKMFDERGLFLLITPSGGKWWRFKYRFDNKEKLLSKRYLKHQLYPQALQLMAQGRLQVAGRTVRVLHEVESGT